MMDGTSAKPVYNEYIGQLHYWLSPKAKTLEAERIHFGDAKLMRELANINWADVACKGIIIVGGVAILFIPGVNGVALAAASSAFISAGLDIQERLSRGEEINWGVVLTRAAGGALKGGLLVIPGANADALALVGATAGYTGIAGVENIVIAALRGEELNSAVIGRKIKNAVIEGASARAATWLCNNLVGKNEAKAVGENLFGKLAKIPELAGEKLSELASKKIPIPVGAGAEAELSRVFGGANISRWKPPVEVPKPVVTKANVGAGAKEPNLKPLEGSVGNSTKLEKNMMESMNLPRSTKWPGYQAQHIIPLELGDHPVLKKIGFELNHESNGIFLRVPDRSISSMSRHRGYHYIYNRFVKTKLDLMDLNRNVPILKAEVANLQKKLRFLQEKGLPLYSNQGANMELWNRMFNNID